MVEMTQPRFKHAMKFALTGSVYGTGATGYRYVVAKYLDCF